MRKSACGLAAAVVGVLPWLAPIAVAAAAPVETLANGGEVIASDGSSVPVVESGRTWSPSSSGRARPGQASDSFADTGSVSESSQDLAALLSLRGISAPLAPESIIGPDNRVRVNPTTSFPARASALIILSLGRCSGWLIGADTVVTAGHCVHEGFGGSFYPVASYRIYPGRNGGASPYGVCKARRLYTVAGWANNGNPGYDYGAIKLDCTVGNTTGWYGYFWQAGSLNGLPTIINGYPGDKPLTQWQSTDRVRATQARNVYYNNDTIGGVSGSAVWYDRSSSCHACALAIHTTGFVTRNGGTRITRDVFNTLTAWRNAP